MSAINNVLALLETVKKDEILEDTDRFYINILLGQARAELAAKDAVVQAAKVTIKYTRDFVNAVYGVNGQLAHEEKERLLGKLAAALQELEKVTK